MVEIIREVSQRQQEGAQHEESEHEMGVEDADSDSDDDVISHFGGLNSNDEHRQGEGGAPTQTAAQAARDDEAAGSSTTSQ